MKVILALSLLVVGLQVSANDSGMPYIRVDDLTFSDGIDIGDSISFKGAQAQNLMNVLPVVDVLGTKGFTATGQRKSISILCRNVRWSESRAREVQIENGPLCEIKVHEAFTPAPESDDRLWEVPQNVGGVFPKAKEKRQPAKAAGKK